VIRGELGRASGTLGKDDGDALAGATDSAAESGGTLGSTREADAGADGRLSGRSGAPLADGGETLTCEGRTLGTSAGTDGPSAAVSGRPTARRLTTVGRMRSSTMEVLFCFSMCRRTRSTSSESTELIWLRTSPNPIDWTRATSAFCSMPSSRATS